MVPVNFKAGVRIKCLTPALLWIFQTLQLIAETALGLPEELLVTSVYDGKHMEGSRHYHGEALDLRSKSFKGTSKHKFREVLEGTLNRHPTSPNRFRVLLEDEDEDNEHFHIQVKKGKMFP